MIYYQKRDGRAISFPLDRDMGFAISERKKKPMSKTPKKHKESCRREITCVDLFAGCGGLTLGLHQAGIKGVFAIEKNPDAFATLKVNLVDRLGHFAWPDWLPVKNHDINDVLRKETSRLSEMAGRIDLLAGGPPCQGFSLAGRRKAKDKRNLLVLSYIKMVEVLKPSFILLENVKGFTIPFKLKEGGEKQYSNEVEKTLGDLGYDVNTRLLNFSDYGIPQHRTRFILFGVRKDKHPDLSAENFFTSIEKRRNAFLLSKNLPIDGKTSVETAIADLLRAAGTYPGLTKHEKNFECGYYLNTQPQTAYQRLMKGSVTERAPDSHRFAKHSAVVKTRFETAIRENLSPSVYRVRFGLKKSSTKRLDFDSPAPTLTTLPDDYIHYGEPRILTVREYARLQSFPDNFIFAGKYTTGGKRRTSEVPRYSQIGNAIPPLFGELAGVVIKEMVDEPNA